MESVFKGKDSYIDFSYDLRDKRDWKTATIREVEYLSDVSAFAVEATNGLIAIGTKHGKILVFGAAPVGTILRISRGASVKFLQFAALVFKLVCIDDRGMLHVWDLGQLGRPKFVTSESYQEQACVLTTSPSHSHAFIGLQRSAIFTYDILCLHRSPYVIPDAWSMHEQDALRHGMLITPMSNAAEIMDVVLHPRDLNVVFVAYAGGVALFDLAERRALRYYSLIIPPGAPGAVGYNDKDILRPRRPPLSALSMHPSGQLFATGHVDGTIAFWAVDDEDRPLMVRTMEKSDINYPDAEELDKALAGESSLSGKVSPLLEPIFKLSWCSFGLQALKDPYITCSTLTVLGGTVPGPEAGVSSIKIQPLILPSPSTPSRDALHPDVRKVLAAALSSTDVYVYKISGTAADFQMVSKDSPHFGGCFNPYAMLILTDSPSGLRTLEAKEFPPPIFAISPALTPSTFTQGTTDPLDNDLASTLKSLKLTSDPKDLTYSLPTATWSGMNSICDGDIVRLEKEQYEQLLQSRTLDDDKDRESIGRGGIAWVDYGDDDQAGDLMFTKRQAHRFLVTHHRDLSIRFQDISAQLLIGTASSPLTTPFPDPIHQLTISLLDVLSDPHVATTTGIHLEQTEIQSVQLTSESTECLVILRSGHALVFAHDLRERKSSSFVDDGSDIIRLSHIAARAGSFHPILMVNGSFGRVTASEMSNIGFLSIAYSTGTVVIIDMRGPELIYQSDPDAKSQKRISVALHLNESIDDKRIVSLKWLVSGYGEDETPRVRLLACHRSSTVRVFTLVQSSSRTWSVAEDIQKLDGSEHPLPRGTFVISARNGASRVASRQTFSEALQGRTSSSRSKDKKDDKGLHCFWISAGEKSVKCTANFAGSRVGKTEWGKGRKVECVEVINRSGAQALVAVMDTREVLVYTLPALDLLHSFQLPKQPNSAISIDDTGDYVDWIFDENMESVIRATLGTLFAIRRVYDEPVIDYTAGRRAPPAMPQPVPLAPISYLGSWFNFKKSISGDALDAMIAGPNRPLPKEATTSSVVNGQWQSQLQSRAQALAIQASKTGSNLYNNLTSAVGERGEMLSGLEESFRSLGDGGRKMMFEAKKLAAEQTGKRWLGLG